jgi:ABC-type uncharacterized transport system involved in gliding motility auxiliary subunit
MSWSGAALVAGILIALNFIASYLPLRLDTSEGHVYSLSPGSKDILKKLDDRLIVRIIFSSELPPPYRLNQQYVEDLIAEYRRASRGHIKVEFLDPSASSQAKAVAIANGIASVQLDVRERDRREVKECFMGVAFQYGDRKDAIAVVQDTRNLEYEITSRIRKLLTPGKPRIGVVSSGQALTFSGPELETLANPFRQIYDLQDVDLESPVPPGIQSLWIIGPKTALSAAALSNLTAYSSSGGVVGLMLNKYTIALEKFLVSPLDTGLDPFLASWGVALKSGLVVDPQCDRIQIQAVQGAYRMLNVVDYPYFPWIIDLDRTHPATKNLDGFSVPFSAAIEIAERKSGFNYTPLGRSSRYSYLDPKPTYLNPLTQYERSADMPAGPFDVAMTVEGTFAGAAAASRLVVIGTSHMVESAFPARSGNYSLLANLMDWSVQDEAMIQIRSRGFERRPLKEFSEKVRALFKLALIGVLPLLTLLTGIVVWRRQKTRRALLPLKYQERVD